MFLCKKIVLYSLINARFLHKGKSRRQWPSCPLPPAISCITQKTHPRTGTMSGTPSREKHLAFGDGDGVADGVVHRATPQLPAGFAVECKHGAFFPPFSSTEATYTFPLYIRDDDIYRFAPTFLTPKSLIGLRKVSATNAFSQMSSRSLYRHCRHCNGCRRHRSPHMNWNRGHPYI